MSYFWLATSNVCSLAADRGPVQHQGGPSQAICECGVLVLWAREAVAFFAVLMDGLNTHTVCNSSFLVPAL
jgi:hypothetical protein